MFPFAIPDLFNFGQHQMSSKASFLLPKSINEIVEQTKNSAVDKVEGKVNEGLDTAVKRIDEIKDEAFEKMEVEAVKSMVLSLSRISVKSRKNPQVAKCLDEGLENLKNGNFNAGRGAKKLAGTKTIFTYRSGGSSNIYYRLVAYETGKLRTEVVAETFKDLQKLAIDNIKENYK